MTATRDDRDTTETLEAVEPLEAAPLALPTDDIIGGVPSIPPAGTDGSPRRLISRLNPASFLGGEPALPLLILFGLNMVDELDRVAFNILGPDIRRTFHLSLSGISNLVAAVSFLALGGAVVIGYYADRRRRVRMALGGAALWAVFTFGTGVAPAIFILGVCRVMSASAKAVNDPTHSSLIADYYPPDVRIPAYGFHRAANSTGQLLAPLGVLLTTGLLGLSWRVPFLLFAIPTVLLVMAGATRLREPVRGIHERRAMGADEELAALEDKPVSLAEAWRSAHSIRTLKRIFYSLPFLGVAIGGLTFFYNILYDEVFHLDAGARSVIALVAEPFQLVGVIIGIPIAARLYKRSPGLVLKMLFFTTVICCAGLTGFALAPNVVFAVAMHIVVSTVIGVLVPGIYSTISLIVPPRLRATGFSMGAVYLMLSPIAFIFVGQIGDHVGIRAGVLILVPVLLIGGFTLASGGAFVEADIDKVRKSAMAQAEARQSRLHGDPKLLIVKGLDVSYGQTQVLFGVDFHVDEGEIVALLGTNGAGKSTLLNAISGLVSPSAGAIVYDGDEIGMADANATVAQGIVMVPGGKGVFPTLTVEENLSLAGWLFRKDPEHLRTATEQVLEYFPVLRKRWNQKAGNLSGGEQQMLTLGQAFIAQPKLLMIDELSLGLAPVIVEQLLEIVRAIHAQGTTIILVEQSVNVAMSLAERAVFMEKGEVRFDGPTGELLERPEILRAVFLQGAQAATGGGAVSGNGTSTIAVRERKPFTPHCEHCGTEHGLALETTALSVAFGGIKAVNEVDLSIHQGQILGLIGPNGAGKTTIFDLISGFLTPTAGKVHFLGEDVTELTPDQRALLGLGRSFQDARLFPSMTVRETIAVALERHIPTKDPLAAALMSPATKASEKKVEEEVERLIELMHLEAFADKFIGELSTGSRRVVDLACSVAHDPKVLLLDEPSSGIAQRETEALGPLLLDLRDKTGASLIVIEHDMPLITGISDELVALDLGTVIARGDPDEVVSHPSVVESYLGGNDAVINRSGAGNTIAPVVEAAQPKPRRRRYGTAAQSNGRRQGR